MVVSTNKGATLIELLLVITILVSVAICIMEGHKRYGLIGALGGIVSGIIIAISFFVILFLIVLICYNLCKWYLRLLLSFSFGAYYSSKNNDKWESIKDKVLKQGSEVKGTLIKKIDNRLYVDINIGFPAELERNDLNEDMIWDKLKKGAEISAIIYDFNDNEHIFMLTQKNTKLDEKIEPNLQVN